MIKSLSSSINIASHHRQDPMELGLELSCVGSVKYCTSGATVIAKMI